MLITENTAQRTSPNRAHEGAQSLDSRTNDLVGGWVVEGRTGSKRKVIFW